MKKLVRITTVPISLEKLLEGQLTFMKDYFEVTAISSNKAALSKIGERENIQVYSVEMTRKITPIKDFKAFWKLYRFFKREKPFIVHTHTPKAGTVGMLAACLAKVPNRLHTVAGLPLLEASGMKRKLLNFVEKITYRSATHIYPNSNGLKDIIVKEGFCNPKKLKVIANGSSNGINTTIFNSTLFTSHRENIRQELNIDEKDFVFVFVGRLVSDKGVNELVKSFNEISKEYENIKLLLVGPMEQTLDPLHEDVIQLIQCNRRIISLGFQRDVRPYFAISDVLVFPSYREGFPNVVMQAGAMGLPCIVSDINGCNEIIDDGVNGIIIPPKNMNILKAAMIEILNCNEKKISMSSVARKMIIERYEQQYVWNELLKEYQIMND